MRSLLQAFLASAALAAQNPPPAPQAPPPQAESSSAPSRDSPAPTQGPFNPVQNPPFAVMNPSAPPDPDPGPGPRYSLDVVRQDISAVLKVLGQKSGKPLIILEMPIQLINVTFRELTFEKALAQVLAAGGLDFRRVDDGYVVGQSLDLRLKYPQAGETELDATYRCRRVGALTLATTLTSLIPGIKALPGPLFLSPELKEGTGSGSENQIKAIGATDVSYRTHDVVISGPADLVRRALTLAQKFDRPRKQVRLSVKIVTISENAKNDLGVDWMESIGLTATEQVTRDASGAATSVVDGIRLGKFSHSPLVVNATINALESKGLARTLSNPTLLILDGERSFILDGQKYVYPDFKGKDTNGQAIYGVAEVKIGVYLQVGVQVGLDNDMILSLYPQVTALAGTTPINNAQVPNLFTSEEQTTVKAHSGEVLVLGGMMKESTDSNRSGVPFLSRIPLLGHFFANTVKNTSKSELMIILTPELLEDTPPRSEMNLTVTN